MKRRTKENNQGFSITPQEGEEEKPRLRKIMLDFEEEGVIISAYDLHTIEKVTRFVERPRAHWEWGIAINKDMEKSQFVLRTDIYFWYPTERTRNVKWTQIIEMLQSSGLNLINLLPVQQLL